MQSDVNEGLEKFSKSVLDKALDVRKQMEDDMAERKSKILEQKELLYLEEAYHRIQSGITRLQREANETTSKAVINNKKNLIHRREEIVNEVFNEAVNRIRSYTQTDDYYKWLLRTARDICDMIRVQEGSGIIFVCETDKLWLDKLSFDLNDIYKGVNIEVRIAEKENFVGGIRAVNPQLGVEADDTIKSRLDDEKRNFLKYSGLSVD